MKGPTQGQKKLRLQFERLIETDSFKDEVRRIRRTLGLSGRGPAEPSKALRKQYEDEIRVLRDRLPVVNEYLLKGLRDYIFYNELPTGELGDVCEIEDADSEYGLYALNDESGSFIKHNDDIEEKLSRYPVSVRIHSHASQRDVIEFIKKNWDSISWSQKMRGNSKKSSLKNSKTGVAHKDRDLFIYEHRDMPRKKLLSLVNKEFGELIDMGHLAKIISNEEKRRKV